MPGGARIQFNIRPDASVLALRRRIKQKVGINIPFQKLVTKSGDDIAGDSIMLSAAGLQDGDELELLPVSSLMK